MDKDKTFEDSMKRLEEISNLLEKNDLSLEESTNIFEEGMEIINFCSSVLEKTEQKINKIIYQSGNITEEKFDIPLE